jgi:ribosomal protein S18 acetylase RimI-like enzyme
VDGLPAGLTARRPRAADVDALHALCHADELHAVGTPTTTRAEVEELLAPAHTSLDEDQWVVTDASGTPAVWGLVWDAGRTDHQDVDVYRDPTRADESVRAVVLDALLARVAQRARAAGYERVVLGAGALADDQVYPATLRSRGFVPVRTFHWMRVDLDPGRPVPVDLPPGVTLTAFDAGDDSQWRALHDVVQRAFADHWGFVPVEYEHYRADVEAEPHLDLDMWRLAHLEGRVVGVSRASGRYAAEGGGWVSELGVLPEVRGRGIARALLQACFEANRAHGRTFVGLGVDTENATGAVRLYESVGMRTHQQIDAYERDVLPA